MKSLDQRSWWIRWGYLFEKEFIPRQVSLCQLFWRCVLFSPLKIGVVILCSPGLLIGFLITTLKDAYHKRELARMATSPGYTMKDWWQDSVVGQAYDGFKRRYCPVIKIDREEDRA